MSNCAKAMRAPTAHTICPSAAIFSAVMVSWNGIPDKDGCCTVRQTSRNNYNFYNGATGDTGSAFRIAPRVPRYRISNHG